MGAAEKLSDFEELRDAVCPTYTPEELRALTAALERLCEREVRLRPGRTAKEYRSDLAAATEALQGLSYCGRQMLASAAGDQELVRRLDRLIARTHEQLRVFRALSALVLSDRAALAGEPPEVIEAAREVMRRRGDEILARLSDAEREELTDTSLADPGELEAWLNDP